MTAAISEEPADRLPDDRTIDQEAAAKGWCTLAAVATEIGLPEALLQVWRAEKRLTTTIIDGAICTKVSMVKRVLDKARSAMSADEDHQHVRVDEPDNAELAWTNDDAHEEDELLTDSTCIDTVGGDAAELDSDDDTQCASHARPITRGPGRPCKPETAQITKAHFEDLAEGSFAPGAGDGYGSDEDNDVADQDWRESGGTSFKDFEIAQAKRYPGAVWAHMPLEAKRLGLAPVTEKERSRDIERAIADYEQWGKIGGKPEQARQRRKPGDETRKTVYAAIRQLGRETGEPPGDRVIARRCEMSLSAVQYQLARMVGDGLISREMGGWVTE